MGDDIVELRQLTYTYPSAEESTLKDVSLSVPIGSITGIIGPSGAGKSTLCQVIAGVVPHMTGGRISGAVRVANHDLLQPQLPRDWSGIVAMTLQDPESQLVGETVEENLVFGPENLGVDPIEIEQRVAWALDIVKMTDFRHANSHHLSGGQKQRVAIASVLTMRPRLLLMDEPTSELDPLGKSEVFTTLALLKSAYDVTVVVVEHEIERLAEYADYLVVLDLGRVALQGATRDVLSHVDELNGMGIRVPQVTELSRRLGWRPFAFTEDEFLGTVSGSDKGGQHAND